MPQHARFGIGPTARDRLASARSGHAVSGVHANRPGGRTYRRASLSSVSSGDRVVGSWRTLVSGNHRRNLTIPHHREPNSGRRSSGRRRIMDWGDQPVSEWLLSFEGIDGEGKPPTSPESRTGWSTKGIACRSCVSLGGHPGEKLYAVFYCIKI